MKILKANIIYDNAPAGESEAYKWLRGTISILAFEEGASVRVLRKATYTDLPENAKYFSEEMDTLAKKWLEEITLFFAALPKNKTIPYEAPVGCAPKNKQED